MALVAAALIIAAVPSPADDVRQADQLLCSGGSATVCHEDGTCESGPPRRWNIPDFVILDLAGKMMRTTAASPEPRQTPIETVKRDGGLLILQGSEMGRAFSFVITEETGTLSVAVAREGVTVAVFGACTPLNAKPAPEVKK
jgi:hypothetical protein